MISMFYKDDFGHSAVVGGGRDKARDRGQLESCSNSPISCRSQREVSKEGHTLGVLGVPMASPGREKHWNCPHLAGICGQGSSHQVGEWSEQNRPHTEAWRRELIHLRRSLGLRTEVVSSRRSGVKLRGQLMRGNVLRLLTCLLSPSVRICHGHALNQQGEVLFFFLWGTEMSSLGARPDHTVYIWIFLRTKKLYLFLSQKSGY